MESKNKVIKRKFPKQVIIKMTEKDKIKLEYIMEQEGKLYTQVVRTFIQDEVIKNYEDKHGVIDINQINLFDT